MLTAGRREHFRPLDRMFCVGVITEVEIDEQRVLNQAMFAAAKVEPRVLRPPRLLLRSLRSALRMSQAQLARRSGVPRAHIARIESGRIDAGFGTLSRLFDAMFCDLIVLPKVRKRPREAIAEKRLEPAIPWRYRFRIWDP